MMLTEQEFLDQREERLKILKNCGIYIIQNLVNGKVYIGSSSNIRRRFSQHKSTLRHNTHKNRHLQNAWNKYGEENFEFIVIEHHSYPEKILMRENKCIRLYNPEYNNIRVNPEVRFVHSEETKRKIGLKSKEKFIKNPALKQKLIDLHKGKEPSNKGKRGI
jgi:group I intron endonuclease